MQAKSWSISKHWDPSLFEVKQAWNALREMDRQEVELQEFDLNQLIGEWQQGRVFLLKSGTAPAVLCGYKPHDTFVAVWGLSTPYSQLISLAVVRQAKAFVDGIQMAAKLPLIAECWDKHPEGPRLLNTLGFEKTDFTRTQHNETLRIWRKPWELPQYH
jgi:hypothetical protein